MKPHLLFQTKDFNNQQNLPPNANVLKKDLELQILFDVMADNDELLAEVIPKVILNATENNAETIIYRQAILKDCINHYTIIKDIYTLASTAIESRKKSWFGVFTSRPTSVLSASVGMMKIYINYLQQLNSIANENINLFQSQGFRQFMNTLQTELNTEYINQIKENIYQLSFQNGIYTTAQLTIANKGFNYQLQKNIEKKLKWWQKIFKKNNKNFSFNIHPRDESSIRALQQLKDEIVNNAANTLAQANDYILNFFILLQQELAFYLGCVNLYNHLKKINASISYPQISTNRLWHTATALYDPCLCLSMNKQVVNNNFNAQEKPLIIITGANRGGKTTFLRSVGIAQLMMQSGMFVAAEYYSANLVKGLFTHFKKEEDFTMQSGKLDEELSRMNDIVNNLTAGAMVLFNESFAATNQREGAEIAIQITNALIEKNIKTFFVTHLYNVGNYYYKNKLNNTLFLRANRDDYGKRNFKLIEAYPLNTSYAKDLYFKIFENEFKS